MSQIYHNHNISTPPTTQHYDNNIITREKIETLFLLRMFDNVIIQCLTLLNGSIHLDSLSPFNTTTTTTTTTTSSSSSPKDTTQKKINTLLEMTNGLQHSCTEASSSSSLLDVCQCQWIIELLVQSLYEVGRSDDAISMVYNFYYHSLLPFNVLILISHLLVENKQYNQAKRLIVEALNGRKVVDDDYYDPNDVDALTQDGYDQLVELLIFHVMFRMNDTEEAKNYLLLGKVPNLSQHKLQGFTQSLQEMIQIKEIEEKNQKELQLLQEKEKERLQQLQQQQQQSKSSSTSSSISNSPNLNSSSSPLSVNNNNNNNEQSLSSPSPPNTSSRKSNSKEILNRFIQGSTREKMNMIMTLFKNSMVKTKRMISETGSLIVPDRKKVREMLPLLVWSTIIFFSIRYLVKMMKSKKTTSSMIGGSTPSKIQKYNNNNNMIAAPKRRNLGSNSNRFNNNNNYNNNGYIRSFKDLISSIFSY